MNPDPNPAEPSASNRPLPMEVTVHDVKQMMDANRSFLLIDCREPHENDLCSIEGAMLVPMNQTPAKASELEPHRDGPIVVHCHHGMRSLNVTQWLRENGFPTAQSMAGGIDAWSLQIDSAVARY